MDGEESPQQVGEVSDGMISANVSRSVESARVVVDPSLSDDLATELRSFVGPSVVRGHSDSASSDGAKTLIYVGSDLPDHLRDERLLWFHSSNAGIDAVLEDRKWPAHVLLTRTVGRMGERIAQYVLGWVLADCQRIPDLLNQHREKVWQRVPSELVAGQTAVVFGVGAIGSAISGLLRRLDVRTVGVASRQREVAGFDDVVTPVHAEKVLGDARWVVAALPKTPHTEGLLDESVFSAMKGATFINVGRGATVDPRALRDALRSERVSRAVLDVLVEEPPSPRAECWQLPRTVLTSHSAGITAEEDIVRDFQRCWDELRKGRLPWLTVRVARGY